MTIHLVFFVSAFALLLFQEIDKFNLFREIVTLKQHMMKIHKWSEPKASAARGNLGYIKKENYCPLQSSNERSHAFTKDSNVP